ncbi:DUF423 domain-containing protein [Halioglobus pacificus]|uniref:Membrane protein n=1 Tax=Parahalioglobus pacificus TaxID=930806 RepID=A0A918XJD7_9GAMM|nr:DUF423 domain-containing protein [Halioglobus pacificus]NQY04551.1 DUF423 domain-containing protein [Halieaceae bacterium]GHD35103.1 membrane protein [Halioglobus pacificus]
MSKLFVSLAAASGLLAVVFGAFGAHALKGKLDAYALGVFETAVQYQFYHALALLAVGILLVQLPDASLLRSSGWLFVTGTVIFSGSLYILSLTGIKWLGAVTPLGGLAFIAGWACLMAAAWKHLS